METVERHPVIAYVVLAFVLTWWMFPLLQISPLLGLLGLFGPALAAIIMAAILSGRSGSRTSETCGALAGQGALVRRCAGAAGGVGTRSRRLGGRAGASSSVQVGTLSIFDFVIFVVVVGEELGWRGFALPNQLQKHSALAASLILGVLWSIWHLPTFLVPGTPQYGKSIIAFVFMWTVSRC